MAAIQKSRFTSQSTPFYRTTENRLTNSPLNRRNGRSKRRVMIWTVLGVVCSLVLVVIGVGQSVRWKVRHVAGRPKLSEAEFAERFFPEEQRETAIRIRRRLAPYIPVNAGRIQPSDRLGPDLGLAAGYMRDLDLIDLAMELDAEFNIELGDGVDLRTLSLRELVEMIRKETSEKNFQ